MKEIIVKVETENVVTTGKKIKRPVDHPEYYNGREDGIECINVIRHYTFNIGCAIKYLWRAGLKHSEGKTDQEKEVEDLKKAVWYIKDYMKNEKGDGTLFYLPRDMNRMVVKLTGHTINDITRVYDYKVEAAMRSLMMVGINAGGEVMSHRYWKEDLELAVKMIEGKVKEKTLPPAPPCEGGE